MKLERTFGYGFFLKLLTIEESTFFNTSFYSELKQRDLAF